MTLPYINVPKSLISSRSETTGHMAREQGDFLRTHRRKLKADLYLERASIIPSRILYNSTLRYGSTTYNYCAVCGSVAKEMAMHEWLITRGQVMGAPFEWRMQIYVPWNCVLVHDEVCHLAVQSGHEGRLRCWNDVRRYWIQETVEEWLRNLMPFLPIAEERLRWIQEYSI
jgi:hypothetical protein